MAKPAATTKDVTKAVIPAAGLGTRFLPATKATPKEMLPVVDKPAIQYVVEEAVAAGLDDVLMITGRSKRSIEDHFDRAYELEEALAAKDDAERLAQVRESSELATVHYVRQGEIQLTDALLTLAKRGQAGGGGVHGVLFHGRRYDTGNKLDYLRTLVQFACERSDLAEEIVPWLRKYLDSLP